MKSNKTLENSLKQCSSYAKRGKKMAEECIKLMRGYLEEIISRINSTIKELNLKNINSDDATALLTQQLNKTKQELLLLPEKLSDDIKTISKNTINITLFGRTMVGKSTLMEILTHGKGTSIGKGAQRTTLDVREYIYRGMIVTDVPGIAAFGGENDTEIAFEAAKKADMVIFLITDDGPQPSEAECLNNILSMGKPVICLINIRANIDKNTPMKMKLFEHDLIKKTQESRLNELKNQFLEFGKQYGQTWDMLKFEFVHLKAAFLSQQSDWQEYSDTLFHLSRFDRVERLIADEVIKNGCYYKLKTYIDAVVVPLTEIADTLVQQSIQNIEQCDTISAKRYKLTKWVTSFKSEGKNTIKSKLDILKSEIKRYVPEFSETHYDDEKAGEAWSKELKKFKIEERCNEILSLLAEESEEKLNDIYREITAELNFSQRSFAESSIKMPSIINSKSIWGWSVTILSTGLGITALFGVPVVGWVALGIGVIGGLFTFLFKSKAQKIAEARKKLEKKICDSLDTQFSSLDQKLQKIFDDELIKNQVEPTFSLLNDITKSLITLSAVQHQLSNSLYNKQEEINSIMINEAIRYVGMDFSDNPVVRIARIAGTCFALFFDGDIAEDRIEKLSSVINETIYTFKNQSDIRKLIADTAGVSVSDISIKKAAQSNCDLVRISGINDSDATAISRIKLAQQISRLYITK